MRVFKSSWVRKLIGKLGVPYNRRLEVLGSSHPLFYDAVLSNPASESNAFRIHSDLQVVSRFEFQVLIFRRAASCAAATADVLSEKNSGFPSSSST